MELFYRFCGMDFRIDTPEPLWEEPDALRFQTAPAPCPRIRLELLPQSVLTLPEEPPLGKMGEYTVWRRGSTVTRAVTDRFRTQPHLCVSYQVGSAENIRCAVRGDAWKWATRSSFLWPGVSLNQLLLYGNALVFHASYICHNGRAILFTAPSQTGKSTQAALWQRYRGARLINGDKAAVCIGQENEENQVFGLPFCGTSGVCQNETMPLSCMVVLSQAKENTIRRLRPTEALQLLCKNLFSDRLISEEWQMSLHLLLQLVEKTPIYALACRPDEGAVLALEQTMLQDGIL